MKKLGINQMEVIQGGDYGVNNVLCDVAMATAGAPWAFGIGAATCVVGGIAFGVVWSVFSGWVCSHV